MKQSITKKSLLSVRELITLMILVTIASFIPSVSRADEIARTHKPRVIATTDGEIDDRSSMIRFLLYACDYDIAGIIEVNSGPQKNGHSKERWISKQLDAYEQVLPNLRQHNPGYPDAEYLRSICRVGNENIKDLRMAPPDMQVKDTPGEKLIIDTLLDNDPRPVHVLSWGGANTTASALWKLKTTYPQDRFEYAVSRIRIYCIWYQDKGGSWIQANIPQANIVEAYRWDNVWDYQSIDDNGKSKASENPPEIQNYMNRQWVVENLAKNHGPLGELYPQKYISEGDSPSFLDLIQNGLDSHLNYALGGWGGRFVVDNPAQPNHLTDKSVKDDGNRNKMYWRWIPAAQNDFAARLDWCVASSYRDANHSPSAKIAGSLNRDVRSGELVVLDASETTDPDGNQVSFTWWQYHEADSSESIIILSNADTSKVTFTVPNESGKQIHIILEARDDGVPQLTHYKRIVCNIN